MSAYSFLSSFLGPYLLTIKSKGLIDVVLTYVCFVYLSTLWVLIGVSGLRRLDDLGTSKGGNDFSVFVGFLFFLERYASNKDCFDIRLKAAKLKLIIITICIKIKLNELIIFIFSRVSCFWIEICIETHITYFFLIILYKS